MYNVLQNITTGPVIAVLGDSISFINGGPTSYSNRGYANWLRVLSGGQFYFPFANNFGVLSDTISLISARTNRVIIAKPDICIVMGGSNDLTTPIDDMITVMSRDIITPLMAAGIQVVVMCTTPRNAMTADASSKRWAFNRWLMELGHGRPDLVTAAGLHPSALPIVVDPNRYVEETDGTWISTCSDDGLHPNTTGAYWMGYALWEALQVYTLPRSPLRWVSALDRFNSIYAPQGNLISDGAGTFAGTSGTKTSAGNFSAAGSVATGWTLERFVTGQTSTTTGTGSKENPRLDGPNSGARQRLVFATTVAGGAAERFNLTKTLVGDQGRVVAGDSVFAEVAFEHVSSTNLLAIQLSLLPVGSSGPVQHYDMQSNTMAYPDTYHSGVLRTAPVLAEAGITSFTLGIQVLFDTTSGSAAADFYLSDAAAIKLV